MDNTARSAVANLVSQLTTLGTDQGDFSLGAAADPPDAINHYVGTFRAPRSWANCARLVIRLVAAPALFLLVDQLPAQAGSATATLAVRATVVRSCRVSTNPDGTTDLGGSASLQVNCATGSGETIAISAGSNAPGSSALRSLSDDGTLTYPIYDVPIRTDQDAVTLTVNF